MIPVNESHETVRINSPIYRVNFWEKPHPDYGWNLDAYLIVGDADIVRVLLWTLGEANGRRFQVFVSADEVEEPDTLVCLYGDDPNDQSNA